MATRADVDHCTTRVRLYGPAKRTGRPRKAQAPAPAAGPAPTGSAPTGSAPRPASVRVEYTPATADLDALVDAVGLAVGLVERVGPDVARRLVETAARRRAQP